ncbi:MAG: hypothetical protein H6R15_813 [Proteobacteria bacterium]|nr:hypothetical protein [Pseudomonadota bacterium]
MKNHWKLGSLAVLAGICTSPALAAGNLLQFDGGIGVLPLSSGVGTAATAEVVNRNIVRGVQPPGNIWVIRDLKASIKEDGRIRVDGRGLLLGGGGNIGGTANQSVFATLICDAAPPFTLYSSNPTGVPLEPNGDFRIDDVLSPTPPSDCASPVLLIRNLAGAWFAAGIPMH